MQRNQTVQIYNTKAYIRRIHEIMTNHIGPEIAISKQKLFEQVYQKEFVPTDIRCISQWKTLRRMLFLCRRYTNCFVIPRTMQGNVYYFVPKHRNDTILYTKTLGLTIKGIEKMQVRAMNSIIEKWYRQEWTMNKKETKEE